MSITDILNNTDLSGVTISVKASDLKEFANTCIEAALSKRLEPEKREAVVTADEFAKMFQITKMTLWQWDNKGITKPVYVGKRKYYRQSDIDKMLAGK